MFTNTDITLYSCASDGKYARSIITGPNGKKGVFWDDVKQSNVLKSGLTSADSVKVFIPVANLPTGIKFTTGKDLIVRGVVDDVINNTSQSTISASLALLKSSYDRVVTVSVADDRLYGSLSMQHMQISCK